MLGSVTVAENSAFDSAWCVNSFGFKYLLNDSTLKECRGYVFETQ